MKSLVIAVLFSGFATAVGAAPLTVNECQTLFSQATGGSASLPATRASNYISDVKTADTNNDGQISQTEFMSACQNGLVRAPAQN